MKIARRNNFILVLACLFLNISVYATSSDSLLNVFEIKKNSLSNSEKANYYSFIGAAFYQEHNFPKAVYYKNLALEIFINEGNIDQEIDILEQLGVIYANISDYNQSLKYLLDALKLAEKSGNKSRVYSLKLNIGTTHTEAGNYDKGLSYFKECMNYFDAAEGDYERYRFAVYTNLGVIYQHFQMLDSAQLYYIKALDVCRLSNKQNAAGALVNLGDFYVLTNNLDEADKYYQQAADEFMSQNDIRGYYHALYGIAHLKLVRNQFTEAHQQLLDLESVFLKTSDLLYLSSVYSDLSVLNENTGDYKNSLEYYKKYRSILDSISSGEVLAQMSQLEMQFETEKLEQQRLKDIDIREKEKELVRLRLWILSGSLLIVSLIFLILRTRHRVRKKLLEAELKNSMLEQNMLSDEVDYHKKELENFALHIVHKNNLLLSIKNKLNEIKDLPDAEKKAQIRNVNSMISNALNLNSDVENLQQRIDKVHRNFLNLLSERFPDLTEKEKRLCVMLKLDLSSKEIAVLNNITEHAVMMARYRLRKKMAIQTEENLVNFLQSLINVV